MAEEGEPNPDIATIILLFVGFVMETDAETIMTPSAAAVEQAAAEQARQTTCVPDLEPAPDHCFHCGTLCRGAALIREDKNFCCQGCLTVFELLTENGLGHFYQLAEAAAPRVKAGAKEEQFAYLDESAVRDRLVDFANHRITRVT